VRACCDVDEKTFAARPFPYCDGVRKKNPGDELKQKNRVADLTEQP